jgi:hypothetical protein
MNQTIRSLLAMALMLGLFQSTSQMTLGVASGQSLNQAAEFRIDTDIYIDESKQPVQTTQAMFMANRTIEWDDTHRRLLVVDYQDQSVTLADLGTQKKCRIAMQELDDRLGKLQSQMTSDEIATWTSLATAQFSRDGFYELACQRSAYRFKTKSPESQTIPIAYADFADWSVKMHAVNPPFKPPLLRLQLNAFLRDQRALPTEIRLEDKRTGNAKPIVARLILQEQLTVQDRDRIRDWEVLTATLKNVGEGDYFRQAANAGPAKR